MEKSDRIYVAPKRGQLPRKYRLGLDRPNYNWRALSYVLLGCAVITGLIWLGLR